MWGLSSQVWLLIGAIWGHYLSTLKVGLILKSLWVPLHTSVFAETYIPDIFNFCQTLKVPPFLESNDLNSNFCKFGPD